MIKDYLDIKNLNKNLKENDLQQDLVDQISGLIGCENNSEAIVNEAIKIIERKIHKENIKQVQEKIKKVQENINPQPVEVDVFFNFLGAIAHLIDPSLAVKFMLNILNKVYP